MSLKSSTKGKRNVRNISVTELDGQDIICIYEEGNHRPGEKCQTAQLFQLTSVVIDQSTLIIIEFS